MECNRDEAERAREIAERKLIEKNFAGAKKFAMKAHNLYPCMDGISQLLATIDVYVFSEKKLNGEADWYGVLGVNPRDSEDAVRKQYRKLVLMLHPDKNKAQGADGAFVLVSQAWDVLSDKTKRSAYDNKILQPQCRRSWTPPAHNSFCNSKNGSNMKVPKDTSNVPVDLHKQKPVSTDPPSCKEKPPTVHPPHTRVSSRKEKPTVSPPGKNASFGKEKQPATVPPLRKHASPSKEKPATVPPPHKHEPSVVSLKGCRWLRCGKSGCHGWMNDDRFEVKLQTDECLQKGGKEVQEIDELMTWKDFPVVPGGWEDKVMSELKKLAPPNGRAVQLFKIKCGCPCAKMEAWSSEFSKTSHQKRIEERNMLREAAVCCKCEKNFANNSELSELPCSHFIHKECIDNLLKIETLCPLCDSWQNSWEDSWTDGWVDDWDDYVMV